MLEWNLTPFTTEKEFHFTIIMFTMCVWVVTFNRPVDALRVLYGKQFVERTNFTFTNRVID